ncbi:MAG: hypothetical protein SVV03_05525, partial [Candidatus Nanohaloarchaea archaeon]|nr:hypothetical protein [Candidatus Nanohaloarchaea archaeon]
DDQNLKDVLLQGNQANQTIDLNDNNLDNVGNVTLGEEVVRFQDQSTGNTVLELVNDTQDVNIPAGDLNMEQSNPVMLMNDTDGGSGGSEIRLTDKAGSGVKYWAINGDRSQLIISDSTASDSNPRVIFNQGDDIQFDGGHIDMWGNNISDDLDNELQIGDDAKVYGNVNMQGNNITNIGSSDTDMVYDSGDNRLELRSNSNEDICIGAC